MLRAWQAAPGPVFPKDCPKPRHLTAFPLPNPRARAARAAFSIEHIQIEKVNSDRIKNLPRPTTTYELPFPSGPSPYHYHPNHPSRKRKRRSPPHHLHSYHPPPIDKPTPPNPRRPFAHHPKTQQRPIDSRAPSPRPASFPINSQDPNRRTAPLFPGQDSVPAANRRNSRPAASRAARKFSSVAARSTLARKDIEPAERTRSSQSSGR